MIFLFKSGALLCLIVFCALSFSFQEESGMTIIPVSISEIENDTIVKEINFINKSLASCKKPENDILIQYNKARRHENLVMLPYKSWSFYIDFRNEINHFHKTKNTNTFDIIVGNNMIESLSFYHIKAMNSFDSISLAAINEQYFKEYAGRNLKLSITSFISMDRMRHYLAIRTLNQEINKQILFIIKDGELYNCVFEKV